MPPTFADVGVPDDLCKLLARRGVAEPFPIQAATLPDALTGRDICGRAPTGSGKTIAFGLTIAARTRRGAPRRPATLVLVPTRELASQVAGEIEALTGLGGHKVATVYGGTGYGKQRQALNKGASVLVACPGRLEDLLEQGDLSLGDVDLVVLDEADRMADMGFLPAVKRLLDQTASKRQTLLFSATLDRDIDVLIRRYQNNPAHHEVEAAEEDSGEVSHEFWQVDRTERVDVTAGLVRQHGRVVVFCRTRKGADRLTKQLAKVGVGAKAIHGDRSQNQREQAVAALARGKIGALVATDVAARGIHVDDVGCVVHFDLPADPKDYTHRSGRTGRAGADGAVVSLVLAENRKAARILQRAAGLPQELTAPNLSPELLVAGEPVKEPAPSPSQPRRNGKPHRAKGGRPRSGGPHKPGRSTNERTGNPGSSTGDGSRANGSSSNGSGRTKPGNQGGPRGRTNGSGNRSGRPHRGNNAGNTGNRRTPASRS
jgi:superfamily II DNA/RNA helicase